MSLSSGRRSGRKIGRNAAPLNVHAIRITPFHGSLRACRAGKAGLRFHGLPEAVSLSTRRGYPAFAQASGTGTTSTCLA